MLWPHLGIDAGDKPGAQSLAHCSPNSSALSGVGAQAKVALQEASREQVTLLGWRALFQKKDKDGGGSLDFEEFSAIVRGDCDIRVTAVSAPDLRRLFSAIDTDDSGQIEESEFCEYIIKFVRVALNG